MTECVESEGLEKILLLSTGTFSLLGIFSVIVQKLEPALVSFSLIVFLLTIYFTGDDSD